ncbi:MAG: zinc metalloprotease HtpX [Armatimonadota bacterium]
MNWLKTMFLMGFLTIIVVLIGDYLGGQDGMIIAFGIALIMNFGNYWFSDKIVLAMYRAQPVDERSYPRLISMVRNLAHSAGLPMPKVYIMPDPQPNAFATGRNPSNAAIAVTEGILRILNEDELEGVIAHELAHVKNRDMLIGTIAATMAGAIMMLGRMALLFGGGRNNDRDGHPIAALLVVILGPIAALLIQMAISRQREFGADETGAQICGKPLSLANALKKLERGALAFPMDANPATSHMFIVNPFSAETLSRLFSTHPPIPKRVEKLEKMMANPYQR